MSFVAIPDTIREDKAIAALSDRSFRFFSMLLAQVDAWGRMSADHEILRATVWPLTGRSAAETEKCLNECQERGLLRTYAAGGRSWLQIQSWDETYRQVGRAPSNRPKSRFPDPLPDQGGAVSPGIPPVSPLSGTSGDTPVRYGVGVGVGVGDGPVEKPDTFQALLDGSDFEALRRDPGLPKLRAFWPDWEAHRADLKKPLTDRARREHLRNAQTWGAAYWVGRARESIANSWQGVFVPKGEKPPGPPKPIEFPSEEGPIIPVRHVNYFAPKYDLRSSPAGQPRPSPGDRTAPDREPLVLGAGDSSG